MDNLSLNQQPPQIATRLANLTIHHVMFVLCNSLIFVMCSLLPFKQTIPPNPFKQIIQIISLISYEC